MSDKTLDERTTAILTEHLEFAPLTLIDDVINAVNEIMYKGTTAIETYLKEQKQLMKNGIFTKVTEDEIEIGMGKLESLLESTIDNNFDKFELYCLRNIFNIPKDLIPYIKLNHQQEIEFNHNNVELKQKFDQQIENLQWKIMQELQLRKILKLQLVKIQKLIKILIIIDNDFKKLDFGNGYGNSNSNSNSNEESINILKNLQPIDETLYFLISQIKNLINQIEQLSNKVNINLKTQKFIPNLRDKFIDGRTFRVLQQTGIWKDLENNDIKISVQGNDNTTTTTTTTTTTKNLVDQEDIEMIIPEKDIDVDVIKNINAQI
ncbi:Mis12-like protein, putative [Candida dubliniensis CD36]|uniref:Kinetochore-associated protein, putative n=1 Tax=Candida dubliniensis (strain CD36 / ATCC MYA-646 / CBS 7987 / NCPF 3949 / NRRL Y-17841) TaxID=573826 RepID=B9WCP9_CANDC|nr:Mis12-like protein, putative [Candida dubliniensis CD36]CAX44172.1 Mis12-like protein, putative [Candida dubliniensis CD36]